MKSTVNGRLIEFAVWPGKTGVDVIRDDAGLTGTKLVCGTGVCGACTVRLDGRSVASCLVPATQLDGCDVVTIEGIAGGALHPVQKAFMECDALQCGFCTPGFINRAVVFYDDWRAAHGAGAAPSREEIAESLSGNLCRCGSYVGIYDAVKGACEGRFDGKREVRAPRVDAPEKVTGAARYTFDVKGPGQLDARLVRSEIAHARVLGMDLEAPFALESVRAVIPLLDPKDPVVRYVGEPIAAVAATSLEEAKRAAALVTVEYEPWPFVVNVDDALAGKARAYEGRPKSPPNSFEGPVVPGSWRGNVRQRWLEWLLSVRPYLARRLVRRAPSDPGLELVSGTYRTATQTHTAFEPHVAIAEWPGRDALVVHVSTQTVDILWRALSRHFGLDRERVRVISHYVGGGFGAKQDLQIEVIAAALLAREAGAPVRISNDRPEEMTVGGNRPASRVRLDLVADRRGRLRAMELDALGSAGVAVNSVLSLLARLVYPGPHKALRDRDVVTNLPPGKPFRAPYGPAFAFAMESSVDEMAHRLDEDPIELRRRWDPDEIRRHLYDWASRLEVWTSRGPVASSSGRFRRGVGLAMGSWVSTFYAGTVVEVSASTEGIAVRTTAQDMGNGPRTVMADAVAEVFGMEPIDVRVDIGETTGLRGPASSGSRTTDAVYVTSRRAAERVRKALVASAGAHLGLSDVEPVPGGIAHASGRMSWSELLREVPSVSMRDRRGANGLLDLLGRIPSGKLAINFARPNTCAVYVAEVVVDTRLGRVEVQRFWAGIAAGHIVSPVLARSQIEGGITQGMGYALYEERQVDPSTGTVLTAGLEEYRIPGIGDVPEIEIHFYEGGFERLEGRASGLSELSTIPVSAAVANGVFHATGHRYRELPLRPDRVLEGLR